MVGRLSFDLVAATRHLRPRPSPVPRFRLCPKGSGANRQHRQRLHGCCRFCDLDQIIEVGISIKTGPVLVRESPAPILRPPSPEDARRGRGRHFAIDYGVQWARNNL